MYATYSSPLLQRNKSTPNKTKAKSPGSHTTPKKKPEWSPYLTEDNKFAISKDEILRRKLTLISKHNMFNGELAVMDLTGSKDLTKKHTKTTYKTVKNGPFSALDLISMSKIEASLEENEHLELDDYEHEEEEDDDVMSRLDDNEETLLMEVSPEGTTATSTGMAREAFRSLSPGECPRTVSKFSSSMSAPQHRPQHQHHHTIMHSDDDDEEDEGSSSSEEEEEGGTGEDLESEDADVVAGLRLAKSTYASKSKAVTAARRLAENDDDEDKENIAPSPAFNSLKKTVRTGLVGAHKQGLEGSHRNGSRMTTRRHKGTPSRPMTTAGHGLAATGKGQRVDRPSTHSHIYPSTTTPTPTRTPHTLSSTHLTSKYRNASTIEGTTLTTPTKPHSMPMGATSGGTTTNNNKYRKTLFPSSPPPQRNHTQIHSHMTLPATRSVPSHSLARQPSPGPASGSGPSPCLSSKAELALAQVAEHDLREISQQIVSLHSELR